jgi:hypothetical protein
MVETRQYLSIRCNKAHPAAENLRLNIECWERLFMTAGRLLPPVYPDSKLKVFQISTGRARRLLLWIFLFTKILVRVNYKERFWQFWQSGQGRSP